MLRGNNLIGFGRRRVVGGAGITLVNKSKGGGTTTLPAGLQENDYVVVQVAADDNGIGSVSGWTTIQTRLSSARGVLVAKRMGVSPDTNIITPAACSVVCMAFRNVNVSTAQDVTHTTSFTGGVAAPNPSSITPVTDWCAIVISASLDDLNIGGSVTAPAGFQDVISSSDGSEAATAMMAWTLQSSAAAIDPDAFGSSSEEYWAVTQALRPAG